MASSPTVRLPSTLGLMLHGGLALLGLASFYMLLFWACLTALPQGEEINGDLRVVGAAAAFGLTTVLLTALVTPWLLDRLLRVQWIRLDEAGDVGPHLRALLEQWHLPPPYLGVVVDPDPCALTYGLTARSARLVVTRGLLESLDVDEQCAVISHEAGHLASGDFRIATVFAGPMLVLTQLRSLFEGSARFGAAAAAANVPTPYAGGGFLTPLLGVLIRVHAFFYAGFSQRRERWADNFVQRTPEGKALREGLLDLVDRLARPSAARHALAVAARGFSPVDAGSAGRLGTAAAWDGVLDRDRLADMARVVEANPASEAAQQMSLHPPPGARIPGGTDAPARVSRLTLIRVFSAWLPALGFLAGLTASFAHGGWFGLPFILWAAGRFAWLALAYGRTHGQVQNESALRDVMEKFAAEPARAFRAEVSGRLVGYGVPGQTWCPDVVLEAGRTESGPTRVFVALRPRPAFALMRAGLEEKVLAPLEGQPCTVRGVLRMVDVPYLELHAVDVGGRAAWRSHFVAVHLVVSVLLAVLGVLVMAPQWAGF